MVTERTQEHRNQAGTALQCLADWGMSKTGTSTLGELIEEIRLSGEPQPAWDEIAQIPLRELATPSKNVLEEWATGLTEREQRVFWCRIVPRDGEKTLDELGREFQVHPTTLRDVQEGIRDRLLTFMETEEGSPILRKVQLIRNTLGTAMKEDAANDALDLRPDTDPHRDLLPRLAGPYRREGEWLVLERMMETDPTEELINGADQTGRLNEGLISYGWRDGGLNLKSTGTGSLGTAG